MKEYFKKRKKLKKSVGNISSLSYESDLNNNNDWIHDYMNQCLNLILNYHVGH